MYNIILISSAQQIDSVTHIIFHSLSITVYHRMFWGFLNLFIFSWRIMALQYSVGFWQTSVLVSHKFTYVSSLLKTPSHLLPHCTPLGCYRALIWVPWVILQIPLTIYFTYVNVCFHVTLSLHLTLSFLPPPNRSVSLFSKSVTQDIEYSFYTIHWDLVFHPVYAY